MKSLDAHHCTRCGYKQRYAPRRQTAWNPDRAYAAGMSYAAGHSD